MLSPNREEQGGHSSEESIKSLRSSDESKACPSPSRSKFSLIRKPSTTTLKLNLIEVFWSKLSMEIKMDALVDVVDSQNRSLLMYAVLSDDVPMVDIIFLKMPFNMNHADIYGNTALHYAAMKKNPKILWKFLYSTDISHLIRNKDGHFAQAMFVHDRPKDQPAMERPKDTLKCDEERKLHNALFARYAIENEIKAAYMLFEFPVAEDYISDEMIAHCKKKALANGNNILPTFVTDMFVREMIQAWIPERNKDTKKYFDTIFRKNSSSDEEWNKFATDVTERTQKRMLNRGSKT